MRHNYISLALLLWKAHVQKQKVPLAVSWSLTTKCTRQCMYCEKWQHDIPEVDTIRAYTIIDSLHILGTRWMSFTGGEPLLRSDIGELIKYAKTKGMYITINTNGDLLSNKINDLKIIDRIKLSFDGPKDIHDAIRGEGSFDTVVEAITLCKKNRIKVRLECVLSKYNLASVDYIVDFARKNNVIIAFQPGTRDVLWSSKDNPVLAPEAEYRNVIQKLIQLKKKGMPIYNSRAGLNHLLHWPTPKKIPCRAGYLIFDILPNGTISGCDRYAWMSKEEKVISVERAIQNSNPKKACKECWCPSIIEFSLMMSGSCDALWNYFVTY